MKTESTYTWYEVRYHDSPVAEAETFEQAEFRANAYPGEPRYLSIFTIEEPVPVLSFGPTNNTGGYRTADVFQDGELVGELYRDPGMDGWAADGGVEYVYGENPESGANYPGTGTIQPPLGSMKAVIRKLHREKYGLAA